LAICAIRKSPLAVPAGRVTVTVSRRPPAAPAAELAARKAMPGPAAQVCAAARADGGATWAVLAVLPSSEVAPVKAAPDSGNVAGSSRTARPQQSPISQRRAALLRGFA
jgi:hypothetical protein